MGRKYEADSFCRMEEGVIIFMKKVALMLVFSMLLSHISTSAEMDFALKIDDNIVNLEQKPIKKGNVIMLPVREVFEKMGMTVKWDSEKSEIIASANDFDFVLRPNSTKANIDKVPVNLEEPVYMNEATAYVSTNLFSDYMEYCSEAAYWENESTLCLKSPVIVPEEEEFDQQKILASLSGGEVILNSDKIFSAKVTGGDKLRLKKVDISGQPFSKALEAETLEKPTNTYDVQLVMQADGDINVGEVAVLSYYARKLNTTDESGMGFVGLCYEQNFGDYIKLANVSQELDENWKKYYVLLSPKVLKIEKEQWQLTVRLGYKPQTVQIADLKIENFHNKYKYEDVAPKAEPNDTYKGIEDDALWRKEALKRIEKIRKRDITVNVTTENGTPIPDADVEISMTKNEFMFGTAVHNTFLQTGTSEKAISYRNAVLDLFNTVVYDTAGKWATIEPNQGVYASGILNWANKNNITTRGHALFWDKLVHLPESLKKAYPYMSDEQIDNRITEHINAVMTQYKGAIPQWDVLNEPLNNHDILSRLGYDNIVRYFNLAKAIDPDASLYVNETGIAGREAHWTNVYKLYDLVKNAKDAGAKIDGIGIQAHCGNGLSYPQEFYNQLDYLSELVDEVAITEYDFTPQVEAMEAPYLRDILLVAYSHPKCTGFITWGFWDQQHWKNHAPFYKSDWTPRETVNIWRQYVQGEWMTNEQGKTDINGQFRVSGHRGEYNITVKYGNKAKTERLKVSADGANTMEVRVGRNAISMQASDIPTAYKDVELDGLYKYRTDYIVDEKGNISGSGEKIPITKFPWEEDEEIIFEAKSMNGNENSAEISEKPVISFIRTGNKKELPSLKDGDINTAFCTNEAEPEIIVEMEKSIETKALIIKWYESKIYTYNYEIFVSDDGTEWNSLCSGRSKTETEKYQINKKCRYIKIKSINPTEFLGIADIEVE